MWNRLASGGAVTVAFAISITLLSPAPASGRDEEGCLICHRLDIRGPSARGGRNLKVWDAPGGPHDPLYCTDCHRDAGHAPHAASPGPATCIASCHAPGGTVPETHRRSSFGGVTESHRAVSAPKAPCLLCHRAEDKGGDRSPIVARCASCHPREADAVSRGVHKRLLAAGGGRACIGCHPAHPAVPPKDKASCSGPGCHDNVAAGMRRFGGHEGGTSRVGRIAQGGVFLALAALGFVAGRILSPPDPRGGGPG